MTAFLLDTNVVSELRRTRPHGAVVAWLSACAPEQLHICSVTVLEIQTGIELTRPRDPSRAAAMDEWLDEALTSFPVIVLDAPICRLAARWGIRSGQTNFEDCLIAATASARNLTVATRNVRHFQGYGVPVLNPFADRAP